MFKLMETFVQNYNWVVTPLREVEDSLKITTTTRETIYLVDKAES